MRKKFIKTIFAASLSVALFFNSTVTGNVAFAAPENNEEASEAENVQIQVEEVEKVEEEVPDDISVNVLDGLFEDVSDDSYVYQDEYAIIPLYMQVYDPPVKNWYYDKWFLASNCKNYTVRYGKENGNSHDGHCASFVYYEYMRVLKELGLCEDIYTGEPDVKACGDLAARLDADSKHWKVVYDQPADDEKTCVSSFYDAVKSKTIQAGDVVFFYETNASDFWHVSILGSDLSTDGNSIYMLWQSNGNGANNSKVGSVGFDYVVEAQGHGYIEGYGFKVYRLKESQESESQDKDTQDKDTQDKDTQDKDTQDKDTQDKDTQDKDSQDKDTQDKDTQDKDSQETVLLSTPEISKVEATNKGIKISWNTVEGAEKYRVYYKTGSGKWTKIANTTSTSYTWKEAQTETTYTFTVRCISSDSKSFTSNYDKTGKSLTYVATPSVSGVTNVNEGIKISWNTVPNAEKYRIYYKIESGSWTRIAETTSTSYIWSEAKTDTPYYFTVRCISSDSKSFTSGYDTEGKGLIRLPIPTITKVSNTKDNVKITWDAVDGAEKYRVYYKTDSSSWKKIADTESTSYTWNGVKSGTKYTFTVRCMGSDGITVTSGYDKNGMSILHLSQPQITRIEADNSGVKITWGEVTGAAKYRVYYKSSTGWKMLKETSDTNCTIDSRKGKSYQYTVKALNDTTVSSYHSGTSFQRLETPEILDVSNTSDGVKISWGEVTGAEKYRVYCKTGSGKWTKIASTTSTSYVWKEANEGTTYSFTVRCVNIDEKTFTSGYDTVGKKLSVSE